MSPSTTSTNANANVKRRSNAIKAKERTKNGRREFALAWTLAWGASAKRNARGAERASTEAPNARATMEAIDVEFGLVNERIRGCPREHNCVSTSARAADAYANAWTAPSYLDAKTASDALIDATLDVVSGSELIERTAIDGLGVYLRFSCAGKLGEDCVEFLVKRDAVKDRAWDGDEDNGPLVLFRSFALDVKYVYPFMTPVSDLGAQGNRLEKIRAALGWKTLGCEVC